MSGTSRTDSEAEDGDSEESPPAAGTVTSGTEILQRLNEADAELSPPGVDGSERAGPDTAQDVESQFGVEVQKPAQAAQLRRLSDTNGADTVREWADEGMPVEAMGTPSKMEAYRQRKDSPVPWDAEQRNEQSKRRNELVQRTADRPAGDSQVPDSVREVVSSPGQSLDASVQRAMEDRMGEDFSDVQVHAGPKAAEAADDINAKAFTVGNHVAFNAGEYDPGSPEGQHVIAHELAHVRQQTDGAVSMLPQEDAQLEIDPDPQLEKEAEETAQRVMQGGELGIQRMADTDIHVQRMAPDSDQPIFTADRDGKTKVLYQGDESKGWEHIMKRHIKGTAEKTKRTSFFPSGQTIGRPNEDATLDAEMTKSEIKQSIQDAIEVGTEDPDDPADVYILEQEDHEFALGDIRVITGLNGDVITAYPIEGPDTPVWKPDTGWENV